MNSRIFLTLFFSLIITLSSCSKEFKLTKISKNNNVFLEFDYLGDSLVSITNSSKNRKEIIKDYYSPSKENLRQYHFDQSNKLIFSKNIVISQDQFIEYDQKGHVNHVTQKRIEIHNGYTDVFSVNDINFFYSDQLGSLKRIKSLYKDKTGDTQNIDIAINYSDKSCDNDYVNSYIQTEMLGLAYDPAPFFLKANGKMPPKLIDNILYQNNSRTFLIKMNYKFDKENNLTDVEIVDSRAPDERDRISFLYKRK